ncbi:winged helix-turn-helix transcriptional regulator [Streptomyces althioticus]|uniref:winged helix-turn-helix transcriptional regulator n=1 Tax=Streptomyces althioticus TaxID=83380 RepID=UPI0036919B11
MAKTLGKDSTCSIARSLQVLGDAWTLLIVREAMLAGSTRFQEFRDALGIAPNILTKRLAFLVDEGLMERRSYREPGERAREEYVLTEAGQGLSTVIAALATWGRSHRPHPEGTSPEFALPDSGTAARLAFVTADGERVRPERLTAHRRPDAALDSGTV